MSLDQVLIMLHQSSLIQKKYYQPFFETLTQKGESMEIIGLICFVIGLVISLVYSIKILIIAFKTSILWGLGSIFVPFVGLIFIIMYWQETKSPFLRSLLAIPFFIIGAILSGQGLQTM